MIANKNISIQGFSENVKNLLADIGENLELELQIGFDPEFSDVTRYVDILPWDLFDSPLFCVSSLF